MKRRAALAATGSLLAAAAGARFSPAASQVDDRLRRIGIYIDRPEDDPAGQDRVRAFVKALEEAGWDPRRNLRIDYRWRPESADGARQAARELIALAPDVLLCSSSPLTAAMRQETRTIPIVFVLVNDPVEQGFVESFARPGGNTTGFVNFDSATAAKWPQIIREIAPTTGRLGVLFDYDNPTTAKQRAAIAEGAHSIGREMFDLRVRTPIEIEAAIVAAARQPQTALVVSASSLMGVASSLIIDLAARYRLPAIYPYPHFANSGGLVAYGPNLVDPYRRAAAYVDRILRGTRPADLPVQAPTRLDLVVNLRTARALGLAVPATLLAGADEVIE